jgi:CRP-like cAMP-binding protein
MPTGNHLLDSLPRSVFRAHQKLLEAVELKFKLILHRPDRKIDYVYFPTSGVVSMVNEPNRGEIVEIATIGREGMAGLPVILESGSMTARTLVQVPGEGFRMKATVFRKLIDSSRPSRELMLRYTMALFTQTAQITSCNRLHEVQQRCARWLLQTHDRADSENFPLTQEFLGQMLGVHRPSVSIAAGMLQRRGLIRYSRGIITVNDRKGLEKASCSCYGFIAQEYKRLIGAKG